MATQAQLTDAFTKAGTGVAPTAAQSLTLLAFANQSSAGQITDTQAFTASTNLAANSTTDVGVGAYQFFVGSAPSVAGLTFLNAAYTGTGAQAGLNGENRFIAQSVALATQNADAKAAFTASYGSLTFAQTTAAAYNIIIGNPAAVAAGVNVDAAVAFLSSDASKAYYTSFIKANTGLTAAADIELAVKAAIVGEIMFIATNYNNGAGLGAYATSTNNLVADLSDDGKLTADNAAGINLFTSYPANSAGTTFNLTAAIETTTGSAANDTFNATLGLNPGSGQFTVETLNALDVINGGAGVDTLNYTTAAATALPAATLAGVEILNVTAAGTFAADVSALTGLTNVNVNAVGATSITTKGNVASASIGGAATTATFTDSATTDTLASVTVTNATGAIAVTSDALTSLTLNASQGGATVTATAGTRALGVTLNGITAGTIADAEATGLTVNTTGVKSSGVTLNAAKATTVTINADEALTVVDVNIAAATALVVKGDSLVTISAASTVTALASVDSTASTGGVSIVPALAAGVLFTGGEGKDSVSIGATTKAITTGGGNDTVTFTGTLGAGGTIDGGTGTDTLVINAASYTTNAKLTAFETLGLGAAAAGNFDATGFAGLAVTGAITADSVFTNVAAGTALTYTGGPGFGVTYTLADAAGSADVLNVTLSSSAALAANKLTAANIETVNITAADTNSTAHVDTLTLVATSAKAVTVTGSAGLNLTNTGNTALKSFDAHLSTGDITYVSAATTGAVTIIGSATGANSLTGGATTDTITGGAKADAIVSGTGLDILTGGGGNDTYTLVANTNGNIYATITDANKGDVLTFVNQGATETFATTKVTLGGTAVFQDYLNEAAKGDGSTNGAIAWFQFGGDTYVVEDISAGTSFVNGSDIVVKLTGLVDLSTATGAGTHIITLG